MAFFGKKNNKSVKKEPAELIKPWQKYLEKKEGQKQTFEYRPVGKTLPNLSKVRHTKLKRNLILVLGPLVILLILVFYYIAPISKVGQVFVKGTEIIPEQTIIDHSGIKASDHIFKLLLQKHAIQKKIRLQTPGIKNATLQVRHFNDLTFRVQEYQRVGYLNKQGNYYSVLINGVILKSAVTKPVGNLPVLENFTSGKRLNLFIKTYRKLPSSIQNDISEVHLTGSKINPYQIRLFMNDNNEVIADLRTMGQKLPKYPTYAKALKTKGVVDLEVGAFAYPFKTNPKK
ncbi:cell division protein FtsQ/DivIB [Agrilactobacillus fermenti]|uniref:cell division protein FtsQ/DivIB n=1 Tax=Agrilactobacillus fermenti TaxID=2586909 RepID=UPI001E5A4008|nr:cell division protein FtsQ/DivIB [Agrilactobacillus fermenti]MCD2255311.1 FtsQ-type POTRA domain-containing protein [Agrilactobacillus fermenti]